MTKKEQRQQVRKYLTELVEHANAIRKLYIGPTVNDTEISTISYFSRGIGNKPYIHIYEGIEVICELLGLELNVDEFTEDKDELFFVYKGFRFMQLQDKQSD